MKKRILFSILVMTFNLSGCIFSNALDDYKTPELFVERLLENSEFCDYYSSSEAYKKETSTFDRDGEVIEKLKSITEYEKVSNYDKRSSSTYFCYEYLTHGRDVFMYICDNGYLRITCKPDWGIKKSIDYKIDEGLAASLNRFVEGKISYAIQVEKQAKKEAMNIATIDNFVSECSKKENVDALCIDMYDENNARYSFYCKGDILENIRTIEHVYLPDDYSYCRGYFIYNYSGRIDECCWNYYLDIEYNIASLVYHYKTILGDEYYVRKNFSVDFVAAKEFYDNVLAYSKANMVS